MVFQFFYSSNLVSSVFALSGLIPFRNTTTAFLASRFAELSQQLRLLRSQIGAFATDADPIPIMGALHRCSFLFFLSHLWPICSVALATNFVTKGATRALLAATTTRALHVHPEVDTDTTCNFTTFDLDGLEYDGGMGFAKQITQGLFPTPNSLLEQLRGDFEKRKTMGGEDRCGWCPHVFASEARVDRSVNLCSAWPANGNLHENPHAKCLLEGHGHEQDESTSAAPRRVVLAPANQFTCGEVVNAFSSTQAWCEGWRPMLFKSCCPKADLFPSEEERRARGEAVVAHQGKIPLGNNYVTKDTITTTSPTQPVLTSRTSSSSSWAQAYRERLETSSPTVEQVLDEEVQLLKKKFLSLRNESKGEPCQNRSRKTSTSGVAQQQRKPHILVLGTQNTHGNNMRDHLTPALLKHGADVSYVSEVGNARPAKEPKQHGAGVTEDHKSIKKTMGALTNLDVRSIAGTVKEFVSRSMKDRRAAEGQDEQCSPFPASEIEKFFPWPSLVEHTGSPTEFLQTRVPLASPRTDDKAATAPTRSRSEDQTLQSLLSQILPPSALGDDNLVQTWARFEVFKQYFFLTNTPQFDVIVYDGSWSLYGQWLGRFFQIPAFASWCHGGDIVQGVPSLHQYLGAMAGVENYPRSVNGALGADELIIQSLRGRYPDILGGVLEVSSVPPAAFPHTAAAAAAAADAEDPPPTILSSEEVRPLLAARNEEDNSISPDMKAEEAARLKQLAQIEVGQRRHVLPALSLAWYFHPADPGSMTIAWGDPGLYVQPGMVVQSHTLSHDEGEAKLPHKQGDGDNIMPWFRVDSFNHGVPGEEYPASSDLGRELLDHNSGQILSDVVFAAQGGELGEMTQEQRERLDEVVRFKRGNVEKIGGGNVEREETSGPGARKLVLIAFGTEVDIRMSFYKAMLDATLSWEERETILGSTHLPKAGISLLQGSSHQAAVEHLVGEKAPASASPAVLLALPKPKPDRLGFNSADEFRKKKPRTVRRRPPRKCPPHGVSTPAVPPRFPVFSRSFCHSWRLQFRPGSSKGRRAVCVHSGHVRPAEQRAVFLQDGCGTPEIGGG